MGMKSAAGVWHHTDDELATIIAEAKRDGRQEGFAEAREMAMEWHREQREKFAKHSNGQASDPWEQVMRAHAVSVVYIGEMALQPPRDEGKREGGDE